MGVVFGSAGSSQKLLDINTRLLGNFWESFRFRKDFVPFFFFSDFFFLHLFWGFSNEDFFLFLSWLIFSFPFFFLFSSPSPGWKAGDHGPRIHLRCSLPVCVV